MPWSSWFNAEVYDRFVRERSIYRWLNRRLVEIADPGKAQRILDLGCGTGATTIACLPVIGPRTEIVGIDASEEMVRVARANVIDPRADFQVVPAAEADRLGGSFDLVLSNAAFWQFPDTAAVFRALANCTAPGASLVFNVPASRLVGEPAPIDPFQVALMREIESASGSRFEGEATVLDPGRLDIEAGESGFGALEQIRRIYEGRQSELIELMSIPAMIRPLTPGLSDERREALLRRAARSSDPDRTVQVPWIYFRARRPS